MLFIKQYWKLILLAVLMCGSNYLTYQYVDNKWELKWQEASVEALKSTLESQKGELDKQQETITILSEESKNAKLQNEINTANAVELSNTITSLRKQIGALSSDYKDANASVIELRRTNATSVVVLREMLGYSVTRIESLSVSLDRSHTAGKLCEQQYNKIREVINAK